MVYKLTEINSEPCMKFSEEKGKQSIPGCKSIFRLFQDNNCIGDFMCLRSETEFFKNANIKELKA